MINCVRIVIGSKTYSRPRVDGQHKSGYEDRNLARIIKKRLGLANASPA